MNDNNPVLSSFVSNKGQIITLYGPASTGKTTFCLLAAISMAEKRKKTIFIDTERGFSTERVKQICPENYEVMLQHMIYQDPVNFFKQNQYINRLPLILEKARISLVIIDTLSHFYRIEWKKDPELMNNILKKQMRTIKEVSKKHSIPVMLAVQVYAALKNPYKQFEMSGGRLVGDGSDVIIRLEKINEKRFAALTKPENRRKEFKIVEKGITLP